MRPETTTPNGASDPDLEIPQDRASSLLRVAGMLWPQPLTVTLGSGRPAGDVRRQYAVLPNASDPRRAVPVRPRLAAAAAVLHGGADESLSTRGKSLVVGASLRLGIGQLLLRDRLTINGPTRGAASIEDHLTDIFGCPVSVSLRLGPPRANLKPVLEVLDRRGTSLGYAKVGINELTTRLVRHERRVLDELAQANPVATSVPAVLSLEDWHGLTVLVLSSLPVSAVRKTPAADVVQRSMIEVSHAGGTSLVPLHSSAFAQVLRARVHALQGQLWGNHLLEPVLETLDALADETFTFGRWHGDWHPGNMAARRNGPLMLWDWERSSDRVPVGMDALHLLLQTGVLRGLPPAESVRRLRAEAPDVLTAFGVDRPTADDVVRLYTAEILVRYTEDRQWTIPWAHDLMQQLIACLRSWRGSACP